MPTFSQGPDMSPTFIGILSNYLKSLGINLPSGPHALYRHYSGDLSVSDKGEILIYEPAA
jgi:hypothetical protein